MHCERCGNNFADTMTICPRCGTVITPHTRTKQPATDYGSFAAGDFGSAPPYQQGYQPPYTETNAISSPYPTPGTAFPPNYSARPPHYMPGTPIQATIGHGNTNESALIAEIVLSLFGIFGIGWIMGGQITLGIILMVCSFFIYWPLMILGTAFTEGIGLICLGPVAIAAIILNALLLNAALKRKQLFTARQQAPYSHYRRMPPQ